MCARVRGTVWCVVSGLRGVLIALNRMEQDQQVRAFLFRGAGVHGMVWYGVWYGMWFFSRFSGSQKMHLIWGSRCHLFIFHCGK